MTVPNRHDPGNNYRYGFNGKEKDNEVKGDDNSYDFGARMYDPRVGRWFAPDKMEKKYADLSPYNFVNNNPILFIDYDGNDFGILIDHNNKKILIVADIYTTSSKTYDQAVRASKMWNSKSATVEGYEVAFHMSVKLPSLSRLSSQDLLDPKKIEENTLKDSNTDIGNAYLGNEGSESAAVDLTLGNVVGGFTENGKTVTMNSEASEGDLGQFKSLVAHEFGHLFGLDDKHKKDGTVKQFYGGDKGIMAYIGLQLNPVSDNDVTQILNYAKSKIAKTTDKSTNVGFVLQFGTSDGKNPLGVVKTEDQEPLEIELNEN
jgi:RHS repeat-associated protein